MTVDETDPETEAMLAGAEIEHGAAEDQQVQHTVRTQPGDQPPSTVDADRALSSDNRDGETR